MTIPGCGTRPLRKKRKEARSARQAVAQFLDAVRQLLDLADGTLRGLEQACGDSLRLGLEPTARGREGDANPAFVLDVPQPRHEPGRLETLEQRRQRARVQRQQ